MSDNKPMWDYSKAVSAFLKTQNALSGDKAYVDKPLIQYWADGLKRSYDSIDAITDAAYYASFVSMPDALKLQASAIEGGAIQDKKIGTFLENLHIMRKSEVGSGAFNLAVTNLSASTNFKSGDRLNKASMGYGNLANSLILLKDTKGQSGSSGSGLLSMPGMYETMMKTNAEIYKTATTRLSEHDRHVENLTEAQKQEIGAAEIVRMQSRGTEKDNALLSDLAKQADAGDMDINVLSANTILGARRKDAVVEVTKAKYDYDNLSRLFLKQPKQTKQETGNYDTTNLKTED